MDTHLLDGLPYPINPLEQKSHTILDRCLALQLKIYVIKGPPVKLDKVITLDTVHSILAASATSADPKISHVSDLVQLGFYF